MSQIQASLDTVLLVDNISLYYGDRCILRDLSAEVQRVRRLGCNQGQVVAVLGPSGKGKTQLFRIISGLMPPTKGEVLVGQDLALTPVTPGEVGVVAQNYPLFDFLTVEENLILGASRAVVKIPDVPGVVAYCLKEFDLADQAYQYPGQLSGGQQQRVAILQQYLCGGHYLLMDEPFSGLDVVSEKKVLKLIDKIASDKNHTVLIITHDVTAALSIANLVLVLGCERDASGNSIPGAKIVRTYDLVALDLCWHEDILQSPKFQGLVAEVKALFEYL